MNNNATYHFVDFLSANLRWGRLPSQKIESPESFAWVQSLGREDVLEEEMATRTSILT